MVLYQSTPKAISECPFGQLNMLHFDVSEILKEKREAHPPPPPAQAP
jgi:hypothetical protein